MKGEIVAHEVSDLCSMQYAFMNGPLKISWEPYRPRRSLSQNALMWQWLTKLAAKFTSAINKYSKDDMHDLMRHKFLGYESKRIGNTDLKDQLRSTATLSQGEMFDYMQKIDAWAVEHGVILPRPEGSEYDQFMKQVA